MSSTSLPTDQAIVRLNANENLINQWVNYTGTYTPNSGLPNVETIPSFMSRQNVSFGTALSALGAINNRGAWQSSTYYATTDIVLQSGTWYICVVAHTSASSWTADSNNFRVYQGVTSASLSASNGSSLLGYNQGASVATTLTQQQKNQQVVCLDDLGLVGDGVTDDAPAFRAAVAWALANNVGTLTFSNKTYYFGSVGTILFDTLGLSIRFVGTSPAAFSGTSSDGTVITGASGLSALVSLTKTTLTTIGYYSIGFENISFRGNSNIAAGIKNTIGGGPSRPFVVKGCTFQGFTQGGLVSDIATAAAAGQATGICQLHVYDCNFSNNAYAIYGNGQSAVMGLDFHSNVCEQNLSGGIYGNTGSFQGSIRIADNLMEGQVNPIKFSIGLGVVEIARNYFEANTGYLMDISAVNPSSTVKVEPNFIYSCPNTTARFQGLVLDCKQDFQAYGVSLQLYGIYGKSTLNNEGLIYPANTTQLAVALDPVCVPMKTVAPSNSSILNGQYVELSPIKVESPAGWIGVKNFTGSTAKISTGITVASGDWIVMMALCRIKSTATPNNPNITAYTWDGATGNEIAQTDPTVGIGQFANNEWAFICRGMSCPTATNNLQISWNTSGASVDISDTYVYRLSQAGMATPIPIFMPSTGLLPNNYYSQTSSSGTTSIVDTGINFSTPELGFGTGAVYQLCVTGWTNPYVNDTSTTIVGLVVINTILSNQLLYQQITYQNTLSVPASGGLSVSAVFWNGTSESTTIPDNTKTATIRLKITGYNSSYVGYSQELTFNKIL